MIEFKEVVVHYPRRERRALDVVSLVAARRHITAVVGPNGSGKSTLVRALVGSVPLRSGAVTFELLFLYRTHIRSMTYGVLPIVPGIIMPTGSG